MRARPPRMPEDPRMLTRACATIAKLALMFAVSGLCLIVAAVAIQVFGRYVLNDTPTWAEALALVEVKLLDHFIVAGQAEPLSFAEKGLI